MTNKCDVYTQNWDIFTPEERRQLEELKRLNPRLRDFFFWKSNDEIRGQAAECGEWYGWVHRIDLKRRKLTPIMGLL